jgi:hypothetical protein
LSCPSYFPLFGPVLLVYGPVHGARRYPSAE